MRHPNVHIRFKFAVTVLSRGAVVGSLALVPEEPTVEEIVRHTFHRRGAIGGHGGAVVTAGHALHVGVGVVAVIVGSCCHCACKC